MLKWHGVEIIKITYINIINSSIIVLNAIIYHQYYNITQLNNMPRHRGISAKRKRIKVTATSIHDNAPDVPSTDPTPHSNTNRSGNKVARTNKHMSKGVRGIHVRQAIFYHYTYVLDAPFQEHWDSHNGTISIIRKALHLRVSQHRVIKRALDDIVSALKVGKEFDGTYIKHGNCGRKVVILPGSQDETLIANWMEQHCGFCMTTMLINEHRRENGEERVSRYAVMAAFYRLAPQIKVIQKVQSGGNNEGWMNASYNVTKQMQIMLGELSNDEIMTDREG